MINQTHTPEKKYDRVYTITGSNIDELIQYCLEKIRTKSQEFYAKNLRDELTETGKSLIDVHAGNGNTYRVQLQ